MDYELWTVPTGNLIDDFASEGEALAIVCELLDGAPSDATDSLMLTVVNDDGSGTAIATGVKLAERACKAADRPHNRPSHTRSKSRG